jgi:hypothetical protein
MWYTPVMLEWIHYIGSHAGLSVHKWCVYAGTAVQTALVYCSTHPQQVLGHVAVDCYETSRLRHSQLVVPLHTVGRTPGTWSTTASTKARAHNSWQHLNIHMQASCWVPAHRIQPTPTDCA